MVLVSRFSLSFISLVLLADCVAPGMQCMGASGQCCTGTCIPSSSDDFGVCLPDVENCNVVAGMTVKLLVVICA